MALVERILLCLIGHLWLTRTTAYSPQWKVLHNATPTAAGGPDSPSIRYSHVAGMYKDDMVVTHGYYYDKQGSSPVWLSDIWAMQTYPPYKWRKLHDGVSTEEAVSIYQNGTRPKQPCGRYGAAGVVYKDRLFMFGGTDGGTSRHGKASYENGYEFDELWIFDFPQNAWHLIANDSQAHWPPGRHLHSAVLIKNKMVIYGGTSEHLSDVWMLNLDTLIWEQLAEALAPGDPGPGSLYAHAAIPADDRTGFIAYGGRRAGDESDEVSGDTWFFWAHPKQWIKMKATSEDRPAPRMYHAMTPLILNVFDGKPPRTPIAIVTGGSLHSPTVQCTDEVWMMTWDNYLRLITWIKMPALPFGHYYHTAVARAGYVYNFGGHLCAETLGTRPFYYLNTVLQLDLSPYLPHEHQQPAQHTEL